MSLLHRTVTKLGLVTVFAGSACFAAGVSSHGSIGFVTTNGEFRLNKVEIRGNAALLDGSTIETLNSPSHVNLRDGARVDLAALSKARVNQGSFILERGSSRAQGAPIIANGFAVAGDKDSIIRVAVADGRRVNITALNGTANVRNSRGVLIARVLKGTSLALQDTGAAGPSRFTGCIQRTGDRYVMRDEATNVVIELTGSDVAANAGKTVEVTGSVNTAGTPIEGASQVIAVTAVTATTRPGCNATIPSAVAAGAAAGAAAATAAGLSAGATAAIVGGVAAAATVGGLAAAGEFDGGDESTVSP